MSQGVKCMVIIFVKDVRVSVLSVEKSKFRGKRALARFSDTQLMCGHLRTKEGELISFPGS